MQLPCRLKLPDPLAALVALALVLPCTGVTAVARADSGPWHRPLHGPVRVLRHFDPPLERWLPGHRGVDLAADADAQVRAAGDGRVAFAGNVARTGVVSITHGALRTTYLPVVPRIESGRRVVAGQVVATVSGAPPHCGEQTCLHWGLRHERGYLDPLVLLGMGPVRLLPQASARRGGRGLALSRSAEREGRPTLSPTAVGAVTGRYLNVRRRTGPVGVGAPPRAGESAHHPVGAGLRGRRNDTRIGFGRKGPGVGGQPGRFGRGPDRGWRVRLPIDTDGALAVARQRGSRSRPWVSLVVGAGQALDRDVGVDLRARE